MSFFHSQGKLTTFTTNDIIFLTRIPSQEKTPEALAKNPSQEKMVGEKILGDIMFEIVAEYHFRAPKCTLESVRQDLMSWFTVQGIRIGDLQKEYVFCFLQRKNPRDLSQIPALSGGKY